MALAQCRYKWPTILLLGDSQTQFGYESGWISRIADHYQRRCDVVNRGFSGYNSRWMKLLLPRLVDKDLAASCRAVTIFLGSNDANKVEINPQQHVPIAEYRQNLLDMCQYLRDVGVEQKDITIISPPPVVTSIWKEVRSREAGEEVEVGNDDGLVRQYAAVSVEAAAAAGVRSLDLYSTITKLPDWEKYVNGDGLHLTKLGAELLANQLTALWDEAALNDRLPEMVFPLWSAVDAQNPASSLSDWKG